MDKVDIMLFLMGLFTLVVVIASIWAINKLIKFEKELRKEIKKKKIKYS